MFSLKNSCAKFYFIIIIMLSNLHSDYTSGHIQLIIGMLNAFVDLFESCHLFAVFTASLLQVQCLVENLQNWPGE